MQELQSPERTPFSEITLEMEADKETEIWYAMRATYRREPDAIITPSSLSFNFMTEFASLNVDVNQ